MQKMEQNHHFNQWKWSRVDGLFLLIGQKTITSSVDTKPITDLDKKGM